MTPMTDRDDPLALIADEFSMRCRRGESPTIEEYERRFPEYAKRICSLFPTLLSLEQASLTADGMERLGEYRILGEIGRGGMGVVYRAVQESLNRQVALKILPPELATRSGAIERFHREARAAAQLHHGHIVPVFGVGEARWFALGTTVHYYAMQYIAGVGLDEMLRRIKEKQAGSTLAMAGQETTISTSLSRNPSTRQKYSEELAYHRKIAQWGIHAAEALAHAHSKQMLHRDVKPSNFLIDEHDQLWLSDFGLAKVIDDTELTKTGEVIGTLRYLAPERLTAEATVRGDIFSLGATLYECLTLEPIYPGADRVQLMEQINRCRITPLRQLKPAVSNDLAVILHTAMEKNPQDRYLHAQELADDLRRYLNGEPILARKVSRFYRLRKFVSQNRKLVGTAAAIVFLLLAGIVGTSWGLIEANRSRERAEQAQLKMRQAQFKTMDALDAATDQTVEKLIVSRKVLGPQEKAYVESSLKLWKTFAEEVGDDEMSRRMRAEGEVQVAKLRHHLKQNDEARAGIERAIAIVRDLVKEYPEQKEHQSGLAYCHSLLAKILLEQGQHAESLKQNELAMSLIQRLIRNFPTESHFQIMLANNKEEKGVVLSRQLRNEDAIVQYQEARAIYQALEKTQQERLQAQSNLGSLNANFSHAYQALGNYQKGLEHLRLATACRQEILKQVPDDYDNQIGLANSQIDLGVLLRNMGQYPEAAKVFEESRDRLRVLHHEYPALPEVTYQLAVVLCSHARLLESMREMEKARAHFDESHQLYDQLLQAYPTEVEFRRSAASAYSDLGVMLVDQKKIEEAIPLYQKSLKLLESLVQELPRIERMQNQLAQTYNNLGIAYKSLSKLTEASEQYQKSMAIHERLAKEYPNAQAYAIDYGGGLVNHGNLLSAFKRYAESLPWYDKSVKVLQPVVEENPDVVRARVFLLKGHRNRARALMELKRYPEAWTDWDRVVELAPAREKLENRVEQAECLACITDSTLLTQALERRLKQEAEWWTTHHLQTAVGLLLCKAKRYAEAEPLLRAGYEGLKQKASALPVELKGQIALSLDGLIEARRALGQDVKGLEGERK
ncbi:MAG: protein kinase [Gemmatales bacterium]